MSRAACERYLSSVRPLLTDEEFAHTSALVTDFQRDGGEGEALQSFLEQKAGDERNWMEEWWEQLAYLRTRTTMAIHINWFGVFPDWGFPIDNLSAAALLVGGMLQMRADINAGKFKVEKMRGAPLDMHQFSRVFGMTRVPAEGADKLVQASDSRHIALMRDGAIVAVDVYDSKGKPLPFGKLRAALGAALEAADAAYCLEDQAVESGEARKDGTLRGTHVNTSLLTALNRDSWAAQRAALLADPTSAASLELVESAMCCVSFERASPDSKQEVATRCHGGSCRNLWFDKSLTMMIFENGRCGINAEHTPVDAMTIVSLVVNALDKMRSTVGDAAKRQALLSAPSPGVRDLRAPRLLEWVLPASTRAALEIASSEVVGLASACEIVHLPFLHFGKGLVKRLKMHPDFFMQMAIQLAMYRMHGVFCATYETGHTRAFFHGRTDTVRTLSTQSVAWVHAMEDTKLASGDKMAALRAACDAHSEQVQRVLTGQGIDRHMLGLYIAAHLNGTDPFPALFSDRAYKLSGGGGNYRMSTSNVGYTPLFGGFAPMTADGYGVCYSMLEGRMNIMITTWHTCAETSAAAFRDVLVKALVDMRDLGASASEAAGSKL